MPDFENLEPYLDKKRQGRVIPVAPQNQPVQEYLPQRHAGPARERHNRLRPRPVQLDPSARISTEQMEKAYRSAARTEKRRHRKRSGGVFERFLARLRQWFQGGKSANSPKRPAERSPRSKRSRPRSSGQSSNKPEMTPKASAEARPGRPSEKPRSEPSRGRRSRRHRRGPRNQGSGDAGTPNHQPDSHRPARKEAGSAREPNANPQRQRRSRRNRGNRSGGHNPDAHNKPKPSDR